MGVAVGGGVRWMGGGVLQREGCINLDLQTYEAVVIVIVISNHRIEYSIIGPRKICDHFL